MLTVACVFVRGNVDYSAEYVSRLRRMLRQRLSDIKYRFVCLTDQPELLPQVNTIRIPTPQLVPGWWAKICLFNPNLDLGDRVLYFDLDVLLVRNLYDIASYDADFALIPTAGSFNGRGALRVVKKYNSSVMVFTRGEKTEALWNNFSDEVPRRLWGDQDYIAEQLPYEATMPLEWFPRLSEVIVPNWPSEARVILCKKPKNHVMARTSSAFNKAWG